MNTTTQKSRKEWVEPELVYYGKVEEITKQTKAKDPSLMDDWGAVNAHSV